MRMPLTQGIFQCRNNEPFSIRIWKKRVRDLVLVLLAGLMK
jgi:hypothetical protein